MRALTKFEEYFLRGFVIAPVAGVVVGAVVGGVSFTLAGYPFWFGSLHGVAVGLPTAVVPQLLFGWVLLRIDARRCIRVYALAVGLGALPGVAFGAPPDAMLGALAGYVGGFFYLVSLLPVPQQEETR